MARPVTVTIPHELGKEEAGRRIRNGFGKLKDEISGGMMFSFDENWTSSECLTFSAKGLGQKIHGSIDIFPAHIRIEVVLPGFLASIAEALTGKLEKQGQILLENK